MPALRTNMHGHVFDNTQDRHLHFFKHDQALFRIEQGNVLRGRDNNGAGDRHTLRQC